MRLVTEGSEFIEPRHSIWRELHGNHSATIAGVEIADQIPLLGFQHFHCMIFLNGKLFGAGSIPTADAAGDPAVLVNGFLPLATGFVVGDASSFA